MGASKEWTVHVKGHVRGNKEDKGATEMEQFSMAKNHNTMTCIYNIDGVENGMKTLKKMRE